MKRILNKFVYLFLAAFLAVGSCNTADLDPTLAQQKQEEDAFKTVGDLEGLLKGMYNRMTSSEYYGRDYIVTNEVRTPNVWSNGNSGRFVTEATLAYGPGSTYIWDNAYGVIAIANIIIGIDISTLEGDQEYAKHMQGQAYAARALAHFDLLKTYGQQHVGGTLGVPYVTEFKGENEIPARETIDENVASIMADFQTAYDMMSADFFDNSKEFMSKMTAPALASRVAVYFEMWEEARDNAKLVIDSGLYEIVEAENLGAAWASDSAPNSIFELAFSDVDNAGINGLSYMYRGESYGDISVTQDVFDNLYEGDDVREDLLGIEVMPDGEEILRNMGKYQEYASNVPIIRYEEVVLNYAEALFELGEGDPLMWLNMIPEHRNANTYTEVTKENILEERREEFIFEGLYFWDLLRTGSDIIRLESAQPLDIAYGDPRLAYPIPYAELDANSNIEQNPGYPD